MARRLDIGIASYKAPDKLARTIASIQRQSVCDIRIHIFHNPSPGDERTREVICGAAARDSRVIPHWMEENVGYAGAVNALFAAAETPYIAYADNDIEILTHGWDEALCGYLDRFHEIGLIFPGGGPKPIQRAAYTEVMWGVGFCFVYSRMAMLEVGGMDDKIGHQNECDLAMRVRMGGWKCAAASEVLVNHDATATNSAESSARIDQGVREFVTKWNNYFNGKNFNYHSERVTRWDDWPPNALYLEEWWRSRLPGLNDNPEVVKIEGQEYDLIKVPRYKSFYRGRVI